MVCVGNISKTKTLKNENRFLKEVSLERSKTFKANAKLTIRFTEPIINAHTK